MNYNNIQVQADHLTRSRAGVEQVLRNLEKMRSHSRLLPAAELEDASTVIHFLEPSCRNVLCD